jgi:S1-C subfamily serine protease
MSALWLLIGLTLTTFAAEPDASFRASYVFVGSGSGVVISTAGEILTNNHVIAGVVSPDQPTLPVRLAHLGELTATLVATDPVGDIALLRLAPGFPPVTAATLVASLPPPGSPVIAVGNPFALGDLDDRPTVTFGVLSTGRVVRASYPDCLQHDAAVNPGNSGGPLFSPDGGLLGITGAIRSRSGFRINSGIGLTISALQLARFLPVLRTAPGGWVHRTAAPKGLTLEDRARGVVVTAAVAPLAVDDVLIAVDARSCFSARAAVGLCTALPWMPGVTIPVVVRRGQTELTLALPAERSRIPGRPTHGLTLSDNAGALMVTEVAENGPGARAQVVAGETLLSANGTVLGNRLDLLRVLAPLEVGDRVALRLRAADGSERETVLWLAPDGG